MEVNIFNTKVEVYEFKAGEYPIANSDILFKIKEKHWIYTGTVYYYKTRPPKILMANTASWFEEFTNIEWWGKIKE